MKRNNHENKSRRSSYQVVLGDRAVFSFFRPFSKWRAAMREKRRTLRFHPFPEDGRPLRVVHIGTDIYGGAGLGMVRLHEALFKAVVDSKILFTNTRPAENKVRIRIDEKLPILRYERPSPSKWQRLLVGETGLINDLRSRGTVLFQNRHNTKE